MIPTRTQCFALIERYQVPSQKKIHLETVCALSLYFADKLIEQGVVVDRSLVEAAALLHDIDKNIPKKIGERHPDAAVRVLRGLDMPEVADIIARHSLHHILDSKTAPTTWEQKIIYLADKMSKFEVIGLEHRFKLWYRENLPPEAVSELDRALPLVRKLQQELFKAAHISDEKTAILQMNTKSVR